MSKKVGYKLKIPLIPMVKFKAPSVIKPPKLKLGGKENK